MSLLEKFLEDLNLDKKTLDSYKRPRNNEELKVYALSLPTLKVPDTYKLAGKLFIYLNIKSSPKTILDYIKVLENLLRDDIKDFFKTHHEILDKVLEKTYMKNFENYNILSASSCMNYSLKLSPEECSIETPCQLILRQAVQFYYKDGLEKVLQCYYEILDQQYVHASPTMFNSGLRKNQMSSCFLLTMGDDLESLLYSGAGDMGMISKLQGGIGVSMNYIRHSNISNTGKSSGVLPFGVIYDSMIRCVDQGGKRNGAMTITLNDWHIDFLEFVQTRDNYTQNGIRFVQANICAYLSTLFMKRVKEGGQWTMFCPAKAKLIVDGKLEYLNGKFGKEFEDFYELLEKEAIKQKNYFEELNKRISDLEYEINTKDINNEEMIKYHDLVKERVKFRKNLIEFRVYDAKKLYEIICDMNVKSSMPYIVYRDTVNYKNNMSNIGFCEGLNLCLEITEPSTPDSISSCNLGHLNLKRFVKSHIRDGNYKEAYDFELLGKATKALVENINKVIDYNYYPLDKVDKKGNVLERGKISFTNFKNRPIGIGVSGLGEVFALSNIYYDSKEAEILNKMIFACIYYNSLEASVELSIKDGEYTSFRTGSCNLFVEGEWQEFSGSPASNGFLQFDLWDQEAKYLDSIGQLQKDIYKLEDNVPIDPSEWGGKSNWDDLKSRIKSYGLRNSMLVALMPTASSAQMLNNAETTEAHQTLMYSRKLAHGNYTSFSEPFVKDMQKYELWNKESIDFIMMCNGSIKMLDSFMKDKKEYFPDKYYDEKDKLTSETKKLIKHLQQKHRGMYEISQKVTMQMARQRGIYVCQSQSFNIYLPEPSMKKMKNVHQYGSALRLKTGMYYLRANPASQTNRFTVDIGIQDYHKKLTTKPKVVCTDDVCLMCQ